ncbi:TRAP-type C4-dicarboxylate transport system, small permease component [Loktanella fryxellensis]|uniref:TRAP transporter small permease protein n=1 Tax=Loktanella fryxellensis TaxID=245187 RepID=A0A1H8GM82_9RHOB|nr:TRAP transporter small permease [Loktanella fryxellensis]SEN44929.1 TRAP-type C4-dicarboxylate transport system, small permease component [Loktanella fryxellensis]
MSGSLTALSRLNTQLCRAALWLAASGLIAMTVIVAAQVWWRYVLNDSLLFVEPTAILLMSWFIFLGSAVGVREGFHMGFEVLLYVVPAGVGHALRVVSDAGILIFSCGMAVYGWQLMARTWNTSVPVIGLPGGFTYMPLFAGGILMSLFMLENLWRRLAGQVIDHAPRADDIIASEV